MFFWFREQFESPAYQKAMKIFLRNSSDWFSKLLFDTTRNREDLFAELDRTTTTPTTATPTPLDVGWWRPGMEQYKVVQLQADEKPPKPLAIDTIYLNHNWNVLPKNAMQHIVGMEYMYRVLAIINYQIHNDELRPPSTKKSETYSDGKTYREVVCHSLDNKYRGIIKQIQTLVYGAPKSRGVGGKTSRRNKKQKDTDSVGDCDPTGVEEEEEEEQEEEEEEEGGGVVRNKSKSKTKCSQDFTSESTNLLEDLTNIPKVVTIKNHACINKNTQKKVTDDFFEISNDETEIKTIPEYFQSVVYHSVHKIGAQSYVVPESFTRMSLVRRNECSGVFLSLVANEDVPEPHHIICIVGLPGIYSEILTALALLPQRLNNVKTLSMLLPSTMEENEFVDFVLTYLSKEKWDVADKFCKNYTAVKIAYNHNNDYRKVYWYICYFALTCYCIYIC